MLIYCRITHYEQRLRTLHYKKKFNIWYNEIKPKILAVLEACKEVQRSKRLRRMLELILAFGNYMNRGQRGNAVGFKLTSLTRIADTKSSCNKNVTLLHFVASTCEEKVSSELPGGEICPPEKNIKIPYFSSENVFSLKPIFHTSRTLPKSSMWIKNTFSQRIPTKKDTGISFLSVTDARSL